MDKFAGYIGIDLALIFHINYIFFVRFMRWLLLVIFVLKKTQVFFLSEIFFLVKIKDVRYSDRIICIHEFFFYTKITKSNYLKNQKWHKKYNLCEK